MFYHALLCHLWGSTIVGAGDRPGHLCGLVRGGLHLAGQVWPVSPTGLHESQDRVGPYSTWLVCTTQPVRAENADGSCQVGLKHLPACTVSMAGNRPGRRTLRTPLWGCSSYCGTREPGAWRQSRLRKVAPTDAYDSQNGYRPGCTIVPARFTEPSLGVGQGKAKQ